MSDFKFCLKKRQKATGFRNRRFAHVLTFLAAAVQPVQNMAPQWMAFWESRMIEVL
jgi:hypothetical protein